jgi:hypothetical protein
MSSESPRHSSPTVAAKPPHKLRTLAATVVALLVSTTVTMLANLLLPALNLLPLAVPILAGAAGPVAAYAACSRLAPYSGKVVCSAIVAWCLIALSGVWIDYAEQGLVVRQARGLLEVAAIIAAAFSLFWRSR